MSKLAWQGPVLINGEHAWTARTPSHSFLIFKGGDGMYTASAMRLEHVDLGDRKITVGEETGSINARVLSEAELNRKPGKPVMLGGGEAGAIFHSLFAAQAVCEAYGN